MAILFRRSLYVVKIRRLESEARRELTPQERLAGWREGRKWSGEETVVNEGHEKGALHTVTAKYFLAWEPEAGDEIVVRLGVQEFENDDGCTVLRVSPEATGEGLVEYRVDLKSHPGRSVFLGEDGMEDAFEYNALEDHLRAALDGDFRNTYCSLELVEIKTEEDYLGSVNVVKKKMNKKKSTELEDKCGFIKDGLLIVEYEDEKATAKGWPEGPDLERWENREVSFERIDSIGVFDAIKKKWPQTKGAKEGKKYTIIRIPGVVYRDFYQYLIDKGYAMEIVSLKRFIQSATNEAPWMMDLIKRYEERKSK